MKLGYDSYDSPIGCIYVVANERGVKRIAVTEESWEQTRGEFSGMKHDPAMCGEAIRQLAEYFRKDRLVFDVSFSIEGTPFYRNVWLALQDIPYGEVRSYADIAEQIGNPRAVRAVGQANRRNPLPILIPCHRVVGKNGSLTGYAGTRTDIKQYLLELEGAR